MNLKDNNRDSREQRLRMMLMSHYADSERAWNLIEERLAKVERMRVRRRRILIGVTSAAAIVLAFLLFPLHQSTPSSIEVVSADPAKSQALLIMSDGSELSLSENSNIEVIDRGVGISVVDGKSISYQVAEKRAEEGVDQMESEVISTATNRIVVPRGGFFSITLSDGTKVWINSESELSYPVNFSEKSREVTLKGEAYFDVAVDHSRPFYLHCGEQRVRVTGTQFNVEFYSKERMVTTLLSGGVELSGNFGVLNLEPGMQGVITPEGVTTATVNTKLFASWKDGSFEFDDIPLKELTDRLGRWYDVNFVFLNKELEELTFTASFPSSENLSFIVQLIEKISSARFVLLEDEIVVSSGQ